MTKPTTCGARLVGLVLLAGGIQPPSTHIDPEDVSAAGNIKKAGSKLGGICSKVT